jgi:hypothetical protein
MMLISDAQEINKSIYDHFTIRIPPVYFIIYIIITAKLEMNNKKGEPFGSPL